MDVPLGAFWRGRWRLGVDVQSRRCVLGLS